MISPLLWKKLYRDFRMTWGRIAMMIVAIAVGIFGVSAILSTYTILSREVGVNYMGTRPASAQLEMDRIDEGLVEKVRGLPYIADAEAGSTLRGRIQKRSGEWMPLLLFVVPDFDTMRINTVNPEKGAWPPQEGSLLVEKEALPLIGAEIGGTLQVKTPDGSIIKLPVSGTVHDPGLAPAWQEQTVYGYTTPETLKRLGERGELNLLKIVVKDRPLELQSITDDTVRLASWLKQQGYAVEQVRIPPPGKHPHQNQMDSIMTLLLIFSFLALVLGAILISTLIGGLLAQQIRQIGIMKSIGAQTRQIAAAYIAAVLLVGLAAVLLGLPPGVAAGRSFAGVVAQLLNLKIHSYAVPGWTYLTLVASGILVPFLVAYRPVMTAMRTTVREAINDYGVSRDSFGTGRLDGLLGRIRGLDRTLVMSLRNTFRRRGRLMLTLGLLAAAGGMFMTGLNVKASWEQYVGSAAANRHYDLEIRLNQSLREQKMAEIMRNIAGVEKTEGWNAVPAAVYRPDGLDIVRTYPDGGHGSFTLRSVPPESRMFQPPLIDGRWLETGDRDSVVLNHLARGFYPGVKVGGSISINIDGAVKKLRVVGITREVLTPAAAYVGKDTFEGMTGRKEQANTFRIALKQYEKDSMDEAVKRIGDALDREGIGTREVVSETMLDTALNGHVYIFIFSLLVMAAIMAVVGALGLMSAIGTSVIERTREFGIMRTIGGGAAVILRNVILEGVLTGGMSWLVGIILSLPLSVLIDNIVGNMSFRSPLPVILTPSGIATWLALVVIGAAASSAWPARKASKMTIRETLSYL